MRVITTDVTIHSTVLLLWSFYALIGLSNVHLTHGCSSSSIQNDVSSSRNQGHGNNSMIKQYASSSTIHRHKNQESSSLLLRHNSKNSSGIPPSSLNIHSGGAAAKSDVMERTVATVVMFSLLTLLITKFGENGVAGLVLVAQAAMYQELCSLVESYHLSTSGMRMDAEQQWQKWWWFLTVQTATSLTILLQSSNIMDLSKKTLDLITCGMGAISLILAVAGMNTHSMAGPEAFRSYLGEVATSLFALFFLVGLSSFLILTLKEFGMEWICFSVLLVVTNDIMAYVFGRLVGRTKLLPNLSPKKTLEGFVGAAISTASISVPLLTFILSRGTRYSSSSGGMDSTRHALVLAAFASIVAPFGGFLASAVKRAHFAKDFGALIPGHGGVVDRVDCQVVMAPFVYLYLRQYL